MRPSQRLSRRCGVRLWWQASWPMMNSRPMTKPAASALASCSHQVGSRTVPAMSAANSARSSASSQSARSVLRWTMGASQPRIVLRCGSGASGASGAGSSGRAGSKGLCMNGAVRSNERPAP